MPAIHKVQVACCRTCGRVPLNTHERVRCQRCHRLHPLYSNDPDVRFPDVYDAVEWPVLPAPPVVVH